MKKILLILVGLALLASCEEFEGGLTKGCKCMKYENDTLVSSDYYDKKENGYKRIDGCLDMQNNFNRTAPKNIRYHCDPETQK